MHLALRRCLRASSSLRIASPHPLLSQAIELHNATALSRSSSAISIRRYAHSTAIDDSELCMMAFADGACRGNPGHGACGAVIVDPETHDVVASRMRYISAEETNNSAEYHGLLLALELAQELELPAIEICMDSELVVKQMCGQYRVKASHLRVLYEASKAQCGAFQSVQFRHVPRVENARADRLANEALDQEAAESELATPGRDKMRCGPN